MIILLGELEVAADDRDGERVTEVLKELRAIAEPHFTYEQRALFPQLVGTLGPEGVEELYVNQDDTLAALNRLEALADAGIHESRAAEALQLVHTARASVMSCDAACEDIELGPEDARRVLAARRRVLSAAA